VSFGAEEFGAARQSTARAVLADITRSPEISTIEPICVRICADMIFTPAIIDTVDVPAKFERHYDANSTILGVSQGAS
jgi:hypothetical protein